MKQLFFLLLAIIALSGCSKDDNPVTPGSGREPELIYHKTIDTSGYQFHCRDTLGYIDMTGCDSVIIAFSYKTNTTYHPEHCLDYFGIDTRDSLNFPTGLVIVGDSILTFNDGNYHIISEQFKSLKIKSIWEYEYRALYNPNFNGYFTLGDIWIYKK